MGQQDVLNILLKNKNPLTGNEIARKLGISKQAVYVCLRKLNKQSQVVIQKQKKGSKYKPIACSYSVK